LWVALNWALGLKSLGCKVIWLEAVLPSSPSDKVLADMHILKRNLQKYDLANSLAVCSWTDESLPMVLLADCRHLEWAAQQSDLLLNFGYDLSSEAVECFKRTALVDIDPGILQVMMSQGQKRPAKHDVYLTIGETVGTTAAIFPDCGIRWHYTPPPVCLDEWKPQPAERLNGRPYTTVAHWWGGEMEFEGKTFLNEKRISFLEYLDLPSRIPVPLELAVCWGSDEENRVLYGRHGWRVREAWDVTSTPEDYRNYIQNSRGEFSCVKPSCMIFQNAWISDRTLCYLASGRPAVVQHTGVSRFLPDADGLFRFRNPDEAVSAFKKIEADYPLQCRRARELTEQYFDSRKVLRRVLEIALN
ncbi:MAG TPA: hypothetical protein VD913_05615, partial [bacterium]|nr:hypothetical protein [bacterium]